MATFEEVANALVASGYMTEADVAAAVVVLDDVLVMADAAEIEGAAIVDLDSQEAVIEEAGTLAQQAAAEGDREAEAAAEEAIEAALDAVAADVAAIEAAVEVIDAAYLDAATALATAELIDEAKVEEAAAVIAGVWAEEGE
jgi:hypothetical protein